MNIWSTNRSFLTPSLLRNILECSCSIWPTSQLLSTLISFTLFHHTSSCTHYSHTPGLQHTSNSSIRLFIHTSIYRHTCTNLRAGTPITGHDTSHSTLHRYTRICNTWVTNPWLQYLVLGTMSSRGVHENKCLPCLGIKSKTTRQHDDINAHNFSNISLVFSCICFYSMNIWSTNRYYFLTQEQI